MPATTPEPPRRGVGRLLARARTAFRGPVWPPRAGDGLDVCGGCGHPFCHPVEWAPMDETHWWIALRCGQCGQEREACATNAEAAAFDVELDRQQALIAARADALSRERMAADVETFAAALSVDLIGPDDFAR